MTRVSSWLKGRCANWLLAVVSVALTFGALELAARGYARIKFGSASRAILWSFKYQPFLMAGTHPQATLPRPPKGQAYRVLLVGGSTAAVLPGEELSNAMSRVIGRPVEVINVAQGGHILNQERISLLLYGLKLRPDLLVTLDGYNDFLYVTKTGRPGIPYANDYLALAVAHPALNGLFGLLRGSQLVNSLHKLKERAIERRNQRDSRLLEATIDHLQEAQWSISTMAHGLGVPHVMVVQPYLFLRRNPIPQELAAAAPWQYRRAFFCEALNRLVARLRSASPGFPAKTYFVDGTSAFDASTEPCFIDECHLTPMGNRLLCAHIASSMIGQGFAGGDSSVRASH